MNEIHKVYSGHDMKILAEVHGDIHWYMKTTAKMVETHQRIDRRVIVKNDATGELVFSGLCSRYGDCCYAKVRDRKDPKRTINAVDQDGQAII